MDLGSMLKGAIGGIASNLGLDDTIADKLQELVGKLDVLDKDGKLDKTVASAKNSFEQVLAKFKADEIDLSGLAEKAKSFLGNLSGVELPSELKGIVEKISGLLGK